MRIQNLTIGDAFTSLNTDPAGLSEAEVVRRLAEFGPNRIERVAAAQLLPRLLSEFTHFLALVLWLGAALAFGSEYFQPGKGMANLGSAIVGVIVINGLFSFWQEFRAERALEALRQLLPQRVLVTRNDQTRSLAAEELVPGDVIQLGEGDLVPADCRVVEALGLRVNAATVTGESLPRGCDSQPNAEESLLAARNILLAGTAVVSGRGRAIVFATGMHTEFGRIAHLTQTTREWPSPLQREIAHLSRLVALFACALGGIFFMVGHVLGMPFWENMLFAIGIIVANVPEGLAPTVTLALAMATQRMARRNALVRHLPAVEALGSATVICCDKTGTLTQNRMAVRRFWIGGETFEVNGSGLPEVATALARNACHCHNLEPPAVPHGDPSGDPMELALAEFGASFTQLPDAITRREEIPFDTDRKRMSVICDTKSGLVLYCKGALETVLPLCDFMLCARDTVPCDATLRVSALAAQNRMTESGLRVLAFAERTLHAGNPIDATAESGLVLTGLVGLEDPPRAEVPAAICRCREAGIRVIMLTGDHPRTAVAIARQIGLILGDAPNIITGETLRRMSAAQLQLALDAPEVLFARLAAEQKLRIVDMLRHQGEVVAVTGDGVNDAPALKIADVGIAMGRSGTEVTKAAADLILLDDNFATIVAAIEEGRAVFDNIRKFLTYILSSNVPEIVPYLAYVLCRIPLPLTIVQILAVDLGTDLMPALALGAEKPDPDVMRRPPRRRDERLLSSSLLARAYLFLGPFEALAAMSAYFFVLSRGSWQVGDQLGSTDPRYLEATTACLITIVVMQIANLFVCRHAYRSTFSPLLAHNRLLYLGIAFELAIIAAIVYTPVGNWLFGTTPIGGAIWLFGVPFAAAMWLADELRKVVWQGRRDEYRNPRDD